MDALTDLLAGAPLVALFLVLAAGTLLGAVRVAGVSVGPAGALFAGLALSALLPGIAGAVPALLGTLGLTLFAYTIGLAGGPSFFAGLKRNARLIAAAVAVLAGVAALAGGLGRLLGLSSADTAGVFAGATTNTPALAAAVEASGSNDAVVGYAIAYPYGVVGLLLAVVAAQAWSRARPTAEDREPAQPAAYRTLQVEADDLPSLAELADFNGAQLVFTRLCRNGREWTPDGHDRPEPADLLTVVGPAPVLEPFTQRVGREADDDLPLDRHQVDFQRVVLSNSRYAGTTIAGLDLDRFDAVAGFVRRGDVDLVARPDLTVELGDRIRVVAPRDRLHEVVRELGGSERAAVVADPVGFSVGLLLGLAVGLIPIPLPGTTLTLGTAAGPLLVGLVLGRLGRTGPVAWQLPYATNQALRQLGALLFLGVVGLGAGPDLLEALTSGRGLRLLLLGVVLTTGMAATVVVVARGMQLGGPRTAGALAGVQGQPAILAFATERTDADDRVNLAYALLFPPTFVVKILAAQLLASW
ncbi:MAG: TrkA C-terminal domain-containing protein [Nitriliruptoraceae bacterium]